MSYAYDYKGRRARRTENGGQTTVFCYDGEQIIQECRGVDDLWKSYYYGPRIDELICGIDLDGGDIPGFYYYDGLGSVVALGDYMGNAFERYNYDVFGRPTIDPPSGNRYMFTGREYDSETGNYYYRGRYYSPKIGRFLQADPIYFAGGLNLYSYCGSNSLNWIDPWGLDKFSPWWAGPVSTIGTAAGWLPDAFNSIAQSTSGYRSLAGGSGMALGGVLAWTASQATPVGWGVDVGAGMAIVGGVLVISDYDFIWKAIKPLIGPAEKKREMERRLGDGDLDVLGGGDTGGTGSSSCPTGG